MVVRPLVFLDTLPVLVFLLPFFVVVMFSPELELSELESFIRGFFEVVFTLLVFFVVRSCFLVLVVIASPEPELELSSELESSIKGFLEVVFTLLDFFVVRSFCFLVFVVVIASPEPELELSGLESFIKGFFDVVFILLDFFVVIVSLEPELESLEASVGFFEVVIGIFGGFVVADFGFLKFVVTPPERNNKLMSI